MMPTELFGADGEALLQMPGRERQVKPFVNLSVVLQPELDGIDVQFYRQLVHCRFQSEKARYGPRASHRGRCPHVTVNHTICGPKIWTAVEMRCGFAAAFVIVIQNRRMI